MTMTQNGTTADSLAQNGTGQANSETGEIQGRDLADLARTLDMAELVRLAEQEGRTVLDATSLGDGYEVLPKNGKDSLCGMAMVVIDWKFMSVEVSGREYVSARVKTADGRCLRINDGGHGICAQLRGMSERGLKGPVLVKHGLQKSEYETKDAAGNPIKGVTYYLSVS